MKSFLTEIEKKFKTVNEAELCEECGMHECICIDEVITVSKGGDPDWEETVSDLEKKDPTQKINITEEDIEEASTSGGAGSYMTPKAFGKKKRDYKWASVSEAMDKKYEKLIESYSKFARGGSNTSPARTVNTTIREVAKKLQEIEQLINYTGRLKNESGMTRAEYGKSTHTALNKISERLLKISERVRRLGE